MTAEWTIEVTVRTPEDVDTQRLSASGQGDPHGPYDVRSTRYGPRVVSAILTVDAATVAEAQQFAAERYRAMIGAPSDWEITTTTLDSHGGG